MKLLIAEAIVAAGGLPAELMIAWGVVAVSGLICLAVLNRGRSRKKRRIPGLPDGFLSHSWKFWWNP